MSVGFDVETLYRNLETALNLPDKSINNQSASDISFTLDSMGAVLLTSYFDSEVGVVVDVERLMKCHSVSDLLQMLNK